jgi:cytochrome oxidase Cu insertion factor (SCO1/SenC/PrrC family)
MRIHRNRLLTTHFAVVAGAAFAATAALAATAGKSAPTPAATRAAATADSANRETRKPSSPKDLRSLIDQEGRPFSFGGLEHKTVLVNFIFTSCAMSCPAQTQALVGIQRALPPALRPRVRFVSVTIDPDRDSVAVLKRYAAAMGADLSAWSFLTGETPELVWLEHYYAVAASAGKQGQLDHEIAVFLIDAQGRLMQKYTGDFDKPRLLREIGEVDAINK